MAEAHPVGFRFVMKAKERGATVIHVDPRFSRTSALADRHVPIRAGSDIAFLGGLIRHVIDTDAFFREYVVHYTNAPLLIDERYQDTEDLEGLFSDPETWVYDGAGESDPTLQHPRSVFQLVRRHFQRYTPEMVSKVCGVSEEDFLAVANALIENSGRNRTSVICYAVGWTQHTVGVQVIRAAAILQLLLGNIGRPGGGIMALRGHASIQGSTDIPTLYDLLPGYLPMPRIGDRTTLADYLATATWPDFDTYIVSLLKAWFGDAATAENDYGFDALPRLTGNHSHFVTTLRAVDGELDGMFVMGQNPAVGSQHASLQRTALSRLRWLVVRDLTEIETAAFWRDNPDAISTEVFLMPAASHVEKAGTFTNTQRLLQWRDKAVEPPGQARSELWFMHQLALRIRAKYAQSTDPRDWAIRNLTWDYEGEEPDAEDVLREINGVDMTTGGLLDSFDGLRADGTTACGCWIYSGVMKDGVNQARRREPGDGWVAPDWGWAWPANRRMLYNRASADPDGKPWSERKRYVWWDDEQRRWTGHDVPDFHVLEPPGLSPPFILKPDGRGWLFAPAGIVDGPLPTHYEPVESPVPNALYPQQNSSPSALRWFRPDNPIHATGDSRFPIVATTFRLTEHHTAGAMSRTLPWLAELQPELFVEIDPVLAADRGIEDGGWVTVATERAEVEARALVTDRMRPLDIDGQRVHQIGLPWHWGFAGLVTGDVVNDLGALAADPNVSIQECKAFTCDVRAGRRIGA